MKPFFRSIRLYSMTFFALLLCSGLASAQNAVTSKPAAKDESALIIQTLERQAAAWNRGDIVEFMQTYWKDERLSFSAGGETTRGWQATLEHYQQNYPKEKMGKLHFDELSCEPLSADAALVLGNWHLDIAGEKKDGNFSLILRKLNGQWLIIHDHSSSKLPKK